MNMILTIVIVISVTAFIFMKIMDYIEKREAGEFVLALSQGYDLNGDQTADSHNDSLWDNTISRFRHIQTETDFVKWLKELHLRNIRILRQHPGEYLSLKDDIKSYKDGFVDFLFIDGEAAVLKRGGFKSLYHDWAKSFLGTYADYL